MKRQKLSNNFSDQPAEDQPTEDLKNPIARVAVFLIGNAIRIHAEERNSSLPALAKASPHIANQSPASSRSCACERIS